MRDRLDRLQRKRMKGQKLCYLTHKDGTKQLVDLFYYPMPYNKYPSAFVFPVPYRSATSGFEVRSQYLTPLTLLQKIKLWIKQK